MARPFRPAICHPDKPNGGLGLCHTCYERKWRHDHPERAAAIERRYRDRHPVEPSSRAGERAAVPLPASWTVRSTTIRQEHQMPPRLDDVAWLAGIARRREDPVLTGRSIVNGPWVRHVVSDGGWVEDPRECRFCGADREPLGPALGPPHCDGELAERRAIEARARSLREHLRPAARPGPSTLRDQMRPQRRAPADPAPPASASGPQEIDIFMAELERQMIAGTMDRFLRGVQSGPKWTLEYRMAWQVGLIDQAGRPAEG